MKALFRRQKKTGGQTVDFPSNPRGTRLSALFERYQTGGADPAHFVAFATAFLEPPIVQSMPAGVADMLYARLAALVTAVQEGSLQLALAQVESQLLLRMLAAAVTENPACRSRLLFDPAPDGVATFASSLMRLSTMMHVSISLWAEERLTQRPDSLLETIALFFQILGAFFRSPAILDHRAHLAGLLATKPHADETKAALDAGFAPHIRSPVPESVDALVQAGLLSAVFDHIDVCLSLHRSSDLLPPDLLPRMLDVVYAVLVCFHVSQQRPDPVLEPIASHWRSIAALFEPPPSRDAPQDAPFALQRAALGVLFAASMLVDPQAAQPQPFFSIPTITAMLEWMARLDPAARGDLVDTPSWQLVPPAASLDAPTAADARDEPLDMAAFLKARGHRSLDRRSPFPLPAALEGFAFFDTLVSDARLFVHLMARRKTPAGRPNLYLVHFFRSLGAPLLADDADPLHLRVPLLQFAFVALLWDALSVGALDPTVAVSDLGALDLLVTARLAPLLAPLYPLPRPDSAPDVPPPAPLRRLVASAADLRVVLLPAAPARASVYGGPAGDGKVSPIVRALLTYATAALTEIAPQCARPVSETLLDALVAYSDCPACVLVLAPCLEGLIRTHWRYSPPMVAALTTSGWSHVLFGLVRRFVLWGPLSRGLVLARQHVLQVLDAWLTASGGDYRHAMDVAEPAMALLTELLAVPALRPFALRHLSSLLLACADPDNGCSPDSGASVLVYSQYCQLFAQAASSSSLFLELLGVVQQVLDRRAEQDVPLGARIRSNAQQLFCAGDFFVHAINILNVADGAPTELCHSVLLALSAVLADNAKTQQAYADALGFDQLLDVLLRCEPSPSMDLFRLVLGMVTDSFSGVLHDTSSASIRNKGALRFLWRLIPHTDPDTQLSVIVMISEMLRARVSNLYAASETGAVELLLTYMSQLPPSDPRHESVLSMLSAIGSHSMGIKELRQMFLLLRSSAQDECRPAQAPSLVRALSQMEPHHGPRVFFDLDGRDAGLAIRPIKQLPTTGTGFTFACWLRIESFTDPTGANNYRPRLFSFISREGDGIEAFFRGRVLYLSTIAPMPGGAADSAVADEIAAAASADHQNKTKDSPNFAAAMALASGRKVHRLRRYEAPLEFRFHERSWYFVALSQTKPRTAWSSGDVSLYVNGSLEATTSLRYCPATKDLDHCVIGSNAITAVSAAARQFRASSIFGQMGSSYFFTHALPEPVLRSLLELGPDHSLVTPGPVPTDPAARQRHAALDQACSSHLFLHYTARACSGRTCRDCAPSASPLREKHPAKAVGGIAVCHARPLKDMVLCLGGCRVILPLFAQLDLPVAGRRGHGDSPAPDTPADPAWLRDCLRLLLNLLRGSEQNQDDVLRSQVFGVLGFILKNVSPDHIDQSSVAVFKEMLEYFYPEPRRHLFVDLILTVLLDLSIWIYVQPLVQQELLEGILSFVCCDGAVFRSSIGVARMMDLMRLYLWYEPEDVSLAQEAVLHPTTGTVIATRPGHMDIASLRALMLEIVNQMAASPMDPDQVAPIVNYIVDCADQEQISDVVELLTNLINRGVQGLIEHMAQQHGLDLFITVLRRAAPKTYPFLLQIILRLALRVHHAIAAAPSGSALGMDAKGLDARLDMLGTFLGRCDMTIQLWNISVAAVAEFPLTVDLGIPSTVKYEDQRLRVPVLLPVLLNSLAGCDQDLAVRVLQDLSLLTSTRANCFALAAYDRWQRCLFAFLAPPEDSDLGLVPLDPDNAVWVLTLNLFRVVLTDTILHQRGGGWLTLVQTMQTLATFAHRGVDVDRVGTALLFELLTSVRSQLREELSRGSSVTVYQLKHKFPAFGENVVHLLSVVEHFCLAGLLPSGLQVMYGPGAGCADPAHLWPRHLAAECLLSLQFYPVSSTDGAAQSWGHGALALEALNLLLVVDWTLRNRRWVSSAAGTVLRLRGQISLLRVALVLLCTREGFERRRDVFKAINAAHAEIKSSLSAPFFDERLDLFVCASLLLAARAHLVDQGSLPDDLAELLLSMLRQCLPTLTDWLRKRGKDTAFVEAVADKQPQGHFIACFGTPEWQALVQDMRQGLVSDPGTAQECPLLPGISQEQVSHGSSLDKAEIRATHFRERWATEHDRETAHVRSAEGERIRSVVEREVQQARLASRSWLQILRSLTNQRGVWRTDDQDDRIFWKLDRSEDALRRRRKFKQLYDFAGHTDAQARGSQQQQQQQQAGSSRGRAGSVGVGAPLYRGGSSRKFVPPGGLLKDPSAAVSEAGSMRDTASVGGSMSSRLARAQSVHASLTPDGTDDPENPDADPDTGGPTAPSTPSASATPTPSLRRGQPKKFVTPCDHVSPMCTVPGRVEITSESLLFFANVDATPLEERGRERRMNLMSGTQGKAIKDRRWAMDKVREVLPRRYQLRASALEVFLTDRRTVMLNFPSKAVRDKAFKRIVAFRPPKLTSFVSLSAEDLLRKSNLTQRWQRRELTNFEYLMQLNTLAGRTYNDITQYPVFPWILADYESETINLDDERVYRDLTKPIGALNEERLEQTLERYESFEDPSIPKFHYGSHYSSAGVVVHYLVRVEPFTSMFLQLQGGRFDLADRMFWSVANCWNGVMNAPADVKELVPEFFYMPELFSNGNHADFGERQAGARIDNVQLPPWAKSARDFVRINREALESDHVSANLHHWIDLIFGFKQRGEAAVKAHNLFYFLTYEGTVDMEAIDDPQLRASYESQIRYYGQTPSQLFRRSHPARGAGPSIPRPFERFREIKFRTMQVSEHPLISVGAVAMGRFSEFLTERIICVDSERVFQCLQCVRQRQQTPEATMYLEKDPSIPTRRSLAHYIPQDGDLLSSLYATEGNVVFSCGYWDDTFKCHGIDGMLRLVCSTSGHRNVVTCIALSDDGQTLVTGSRDSTVRVWRVVVDEKARSSNKQRYVTCEPVHILQGHDDQVTSVAVSVDQDLVASASRDGSVILHTLRKGRYVRSMYHPSRAAVHTVKIAADGTLVWYSLADLVLRVASVNAEEILATDCMERLRAIELSRDSAYVVTGGDKGTVLIRRIHDLEIIHRWSVQGAVSAIDILGNELMAVGTEKGVLHVANLAMARR